MRGKLKYMESAERKRADRKDEKRIEIELASIRDRVLLLDSAEEKSRILEERAKSFADESSKYEELIANLTEKERLLASRNADAQEESARFMRLFYMSLGAVGLLLVIVIALLIWK